EGVSVLLGNGNSTFQAAFRYGAGTNPILVALGDLNNDRKLDLAVLNPGDCLSSGSDSTVSVLLGNGDGALQRAVSYNAVEGPFGLATGDFNGDGKLRSGSYDPTSQSNANASILVLLGKGDGPSKPPAIMREPMPTCMQWLISTAMAGGP